MTPLPRGVYGVAAAALVASTLGQACRSSSVSVSPASASVTTGQTVRLTATAKDASGNPATGRPIAWVSGNAAIATVSGTGLVAGVAVGVDTVRATSGSRSGNAVVTVTPASSLWAHEPPAFTGLATLDGGRDHDFVLQDVNGTSPTTSGWYNEYPSAFANGQLALVTDSSAPSPNNVVQVKYPIGWNVAGAPGQWQFNHRPVTEYYLGFYFKISNPYQGVGGGHNKIAYIYSGNKDLVFEFYPQTSSGNGNSSAGPWGFLFAEYVSHNGAEFDTYGTTRLMSGVWYNVAILMSYSQGVLKWWVNGTLDGAVPCDFNANAGGPLHLTYFSPTYGGGGLPPKSQVDYLWYNHVHMSGLP